MPARERALAQLQDFLPRAGREYASTRNYDFGPGNRKNISTLSPYIRYRIITESEVVAAVLKKYSWSAAEKFVQEVMWRTYWKGWLEMRPGVWRRFLVEEARFSDDFRHHEALLAAENGATGIEGFDDWAHELVQTGYLHNHARMWFASIWIFTLKLPWTLGASFFLRHLIDADPASNTLSWRWVAGLQTTGKVYLATADNIARYTEGRFCPKGLATHAQALHENSEPDRVLLPTIANNVIVGKTMLLLTGEDLCPESLITSAESIVGIVIASRVDGAWPRGSKASDFLSAAVRDTSLRISAYYGCHAEVISSLDPLLVIAACEAAGAKTVITPYAPVGPIADALRVLELSLTSSGLSLIRRCRLWDQQLWPYAKKGFFQFKENVPAALIDMGINIERPGLPT